MANISRLSTMWKPEDGVLDISREELVRILGEEIVSRAETLDEEAFQQGKWNRLPALLHAYEKVYHKRVFEARRSYLTGLDEELKILLVRHIFDQQELAEL